MAFKENDRVKATPDGPVMTVSFQDYSDMVYVFWFDVNQHVQRNKFQAGQLKIAPKEKE